MQTNTTNHYNGSGNFPERLHYVLDEMARDHQEHIMGWDETGSGFQVHDRNLLEKEILPNFFRQTKYTSFQRQLNIYGFTRITTGPRKGSYCHDLFIRNMPELAQQIPRKDIKKGIRSQIRASSQQSVTAVPKDLVYPGLQHTTSRRGSLAQDRSLEGVPLNWSMRNINRSPSLNLAYLCAQNEGAGPIINSVTNPSTFGTSLAFASRQFASQYNQGNALLGREVPNGVLHSPLSPAANSQDLINKALILMRSNNNLGR
ncbi:hypothetical protein FisN_16Lh320 [Fistulifera solaris]|uniref:HSF-type DNA-binding domain-containing protein n=1 Tax=Fistulifera solaris TaxID=1519565 RepID=A0A1Z5KNY3_FISSO|nr:hypothetical protein FisN_16Lh320 [Fistulifera solaris]|eukprot:GAX27986.1 hypothetical protein FisN_16Lh320 [Fistulifera solaris]